MAAAAAAAAALPKGEPKEKKGGNTAAMLFVGGIVVLSGAVGYAKWSNDNPSILHKKKADTIAQQKASAAAAKAEEAAKKVDDLVTEKEIKEKAKVEEVKTPTPAPAAAAEEKKEAVEEKAAPKKQQKEEEKLKQPFAAAAGGDDTEEDKEAKKKAAAIEAAKKEQEAKKQKEAAADKAKEATIKPLVQALKKVVNMDIEANLDIETDVSRRPYFAGHHIFAKKPIPAGTPVISLTGPLQFSVRTVDKQLQQGMAVLVHHAANIPSVKDHLAQSPYYNITSLLPKLHDDKDLFNIGGDGDSEEDETEPQPTSALDGDIHLLTLSLALEKRKEKRSIWHPWIDSLPPMHHLAQQHGMFVNDEEYRACLPPRGQRLVNDMRLEMMWIRNATAELCKAKIPKLEPKLDTFRSQQERQSRGEKIKNFVKFSELERAAIMARYLVCDVSQMDLDWAYTIISARSHLIGNVRTIFPLVDVMPYAVSATVKPGQIQATDEGKIVSLEFVAARNIEEDEPLSFRTSIREPMEAVLAQGFFDTDFFTDNNVPIGIFYQFDRDGETFNSPDLGEDVVHCANDFVARSVPESGEISPEMLLCAEMVFLKNVTGTADFEIEKLQSLREAHVEAYIAEQKAVKALGKKAPAQTVESLAVVAPVSAEAEAAALIATPTRQTIRDNALEFIRSALVSTADVYKTKDKCPEDGRALMGEVQSHNDYVVAILDKSKALLGIAPEKPAMAE